MRNIFFGYISLLFFCTPCIAGDQDPLESKRSTIYFKFSSKNPGRINDRGIALHSSKDLNLSGCWGDDEPHDCVDFCCLYVLCGPCFCFTSIVDTAVNRTRNLRSWLSPQYIRASRNEFILPKALNTHIKQEHFILNIDRLYKLVFTKKICVSISYKETEDSLEEFVFEKEIRNHRYPKVVTLKYMREQLDERYSTLSQQMREFEQDIFYSETEKSKKTLYQEILANLIEGMNDSTKIYQFTLSKKEILELKENPDLSFVEFFHILGEKEVDNSDEESTTETSTE